MTVRELLPQSAAVPDSDYIIIGGTGDLSLRKIFPALFLRYAAGQVTDDFRFFVLGRQTITAEDFKAKLKPHCLAGMETIPDGEASLDRFIGLIEFNAIDISTKNSMAGLAEKLLNGADETRPIIFYMSIAPSLFSEACQRINEAGLVLPQSRLVVEKPLGHDRASSLEINDKLLAVFNESQIYRIDHYLGKETVQNLMALRFANVIFGALEQPLYR